MVAVAQLGPLVRHVRRPDAQVAEELNVLADAHRLDAQQLRHRVAQHLGKRTGQCRADPSYVLQAVFSKIHRVLLVIVEQ